ncbi:MAG: coth protein-domain-containing protein [Benniella sp.]|nr:MAG: coth protein-domain-containing protein [Benniella sp.]
MVRLIIGLAACAAMVMADVTFNLGGLREDPSQEFAVQINGKIIKLATSQEAYPLWSANVARVEGPLEYKYVQLGKGGKVENEEKASRKLPQGALHTPNEFFDRSTTLYDLPPLPQVFENKLEQNSPFFRGGYIGNLFIEGDEAQWKHINKGGEEFYPPPIKVSVQYIGANDNVKIKDVIFNLSGQSSREYAKLAYQMKFPKKQRLLDLSTLKLRNEETDATMMREKIYVDILNSLGVPAQQSAYVRLFFNGEPVGLFVAVEEMKKHWIKKVLHPGVKGVKPGALWKMNSCCGHEGNLEWLGPTTKSYVVGDIYKNIVPGNNTKDVLMKDLIQFMAELKNYNPGEFYNDPVTGKWTWLPTDFDDTFGTSFDGKLGSYKDIPKKNKKGFESPLAQKLIMETPQIKDRFEEILKDIVDYVFKLDALSPRLDAYKEMIQEDVAWDRSLQRLSKGKNEKFTAEDLDKGIDNGVKGGWGIKKWVKERSEGVQKDLGFKATAGTPPSATIVAKANSTKSVVGKEEHGTMSSQNDAPALSSSGNQAENKGDGKGKKNETIMSSAEVLKATWTTLGVMAATLAIVAL